MTSAPPLDPHRIKAYNRAKSEAIGASGGPNSWHYLLTPALKRALVAERLIALLFVQDEQDVTDAVIRDMLNSLMDHLNHDPELIPR